ncbi:hypothetical protein DPMN_133793 [Dreissena polymorpha]|uniref:Metalloendopeptidase n=1 Tax=Dreissena polymorpha TaxID=45954 RepID=A0A9D4JBC2_DREPO|nr:hypothetical protein DPMN_133793 [Dreissena polymorpha]
MAKKCWQRFEIVFESLKIATLRKLNLYERLSERMKYPYSNNTLLHSSAVFQKGLYLHEIGHAIGLVHKHQLPNRDQNIEILYQNVQPSMRIWFNKYSAQEVDQLKVDYEYSYVRVILRLISARSFSINLPSTKHVYCFIVAYSF